MNTREVLLHSHEKVAVTSLVTSADAMGYIRMQEGVVTRFLDVNKLSERRQYMTESKWSALALYDGFFYYGSGYHLHEVEMKTDGAPARRKIRCLGLPEHIACDRARLIVTTRRFFVVHDRASLTPLITVSALSFNIL